MKTEIKTLIYSMLNNLLIALIKIFSGIFYGLSSLLADGMHTLSDFVTDIVCLIGSKISKKKPTKYHPFGFGQVEYLTNLFVGVILFGLSLYIIISSFFKEAVIPPLSVLIVLLIVFILKLGAILIMHKVGAKINSQLLITSVEESKADLYSTVGVFIITILLQFSDSIHFLEKADIVGSILIGLIVLKTAFKIIWDNSLSIIGEIDNNKELIAKIKEVIYENKEVLKDKMRLIKYGPYYRLQLCLELDDKLTLKKVTNVEIKIKKDIIRHHSLKVKHVMIYVTDDINKIGN